MKKRSVFLKLITTLLVTTQLFSLSFAENVDMNSTTRTKNEMDIAFEKELELENLENLTDLQDLGNIPGINVDLLGNPTFVKGNSIYKFGDHISRSTPTGIVFRKKRQVVKITTNFVSSIVDRTNNTDTPIPGSNYSKAEDEGKLVYYKLPMPSNTLDYVIDLNAIHDVYDMLMFKNKTGFEQYFVVKAKKADDGSDVVNYKVSYIKKFRPLSVAPIDVDTLEVTYDGDISNDISDVKKITVSVPEGEGSELTTGLAYKNNMKYLIETINKLKSDKLVPLQEKTDDITEEKFEEYYKTATEGYDYSIDYKTFMELEADWVYYNDLTTDDEALKNMNPRVAVDLINTTLTKINTFLDHIAKVDADDKNGRIPAKGNFLIDVFGDENFVPQLPDDVEIKENVEKYKEIGKADIEVDGKKVRIKGLTNILKNADKVVVNIPYRMFKDMDTYDVKGDVFNVDVNKHNITPISGEINEKTKIDMELDRPVTSETLDNPANVIVEVGTPGSPDVIKYPVRKIEIDGAKLKIHFGDNDNKIGPNNTVRVLIPGQTFTPLDPLNERVTDIDYNVVNKLKDEPKPPVVPPVNPPNNPKPNNPSGGGGGGGSSKKPTPKTPDKTPKRETKLNIEDHYAYMVGYPDLTFRPDAQITRAEVTMMFARLLKDRPVGTPFNAKRYSDVTEANWFSYAVDYMSEQNIIKGYPDGTFRPNDPITRAEFASISARFDKLPDAGKSVFSDVANNHWASETIAQSAKKGWISGYPDGTFKPEQNISRIEVVSSTNRILNRYVDMEFAQKHKAELAPMIDVTDKHWGYGTLIEAMNGHDYVRLADGKSEQWQKLNGKSFDFPTSLKK